MRLSLEKTLTALKTILLPDQNKNVVRIYSHAFTSQKYLDVYHFDMQYCDLTLEDYIKYHQDQLDLPIGIEAIQVSNPAFVTKNSPALIKAENTWVIGDHIALGLEYLHTNGIIHKALQPSHGILILSIGKLIY